MSAQGKKLTGNKIAIGVRLKPEDYERLKRLAEANRRTVGNLAAILIEDGLAVQEHEFKPRTRRDGT